MTARHGRPPNVVMVFPDQWRGEALGFAGNRQVRTAAADRLAREGAAIHRAYTTDPLCTPARAALLTGRYPHTTGCTNNRMQLAPEEIGFAELLTDLGYACGYVGKWHLDADERPGYAYVPPGPRRQGFDAYWVTFRGDRPHRQTVHHADDPDHPVRLDGYEPPYQTDLAIEFIRRQAGANQPFCLMLCWRPPHPPHDPPEEFRRLFPVERLQFLPNARPPHAPEPDEAGRRWMSGYLGHIAAVDVQFTRLLDTLDHLGIAEDTIVAFSSDHGDQVGSQGRYGKNVPYDESCRVPGLWRWPGRIPARSRPDLTYGHVDFAPTLLGLCGAPIPAAVQGTDLSRWLLGTADGEPPQTAYVEARIGSRNPQTPEWRGLRTPHHWAAALLPPETAEARLTHLYDMDSDPYQISNLAGDPAARELEADQLAVLRAMARSTGDPHPALR